MTRLNSFGARQDLHVGQETYEIYSLEKLERGGFPQVARLP